MTKYPKEWRPFDIACTKFSPEEKRRVFDEYAELEKDDWRKLTFEQCQNSISASP